MVKKSGSTKLKRQMAPKFWEIKRKGFPFILSAKPGPYAKDKCYPIGVILRDVLHLCNSLAEAKKIMNSGQVKIDGVVRHDVNFGVGIMDVIELISSKESYRLIPKESKILIPVKTKENQVKLLKITKKVSIKGNKIQYGFHDGKTLISEDKQMNVGDVCLMTIPDMKIKNHIKFDVGCSVLIVQGENAGRIGKVDEIKDGMFSLPKRVVLTFDDKTVDLPINIVMPIGMDTPVLEVFN